MTVSDVHGARHADRLDRLRARDVFFASNLVYYLFWVFCGVNVPL